MTPANSQWPEATFRVKVRVKPQSPVIPEGFIAHDGGPCPVAEGTRGRVLCRGGQAYLEMAMSSRWDWRHIGNSHDIIAYKPERSPDFRVEAGKFYITASGERVGPMRRLIGGTFDLGWHDGRLWRASGEVKGRTPSDAILCLAADQTPMVSE